MPVPIVMSYSGGKDSSYGLFKLMHDERFEVKRLLTTASTEYQRNSMHGVRIDVLRKQASSIGLPLDVVWTNSTGGAADYEAKMRAILREYKDNGIEHVAFGDLYLQDVREYRQKLNDSVGISSVFPIWGTPTKELAMEFIDQGFKSIVVCVDTTQLDRSFCGRAFDKQFLLDLPADIDWCAENGEFHTFCYDGPVFSHVVRVSKGETVLREGRFYFTDLLPQE